MASDRLARILDDAYVAGLEELPLAEVRARRADCQEVELGLSYARRIVQGRVDIVGAEVACRQAGRGRSATAELVARLQSGEMIADQRRPEGYGRLITLLEPGDDVEGFLDEIDAVADDASLTGLPDSSDESLGELLERLRNVERSLSERRRAVLDRIDACQHEIVRRYKEGVADPDALLS